MKPLCSYKECPWRFDPDKHIPFCGHVPGHPHSNVVTHQHKPRRSQMKNPPIVALLCPSMHDMVDNGTKFKDMVAKWPGTDVAAYGSRRFYRLWEAGKDYRDRDYALIWKEIPNGTGNQDSPDAGVRYGDVPDGVPDVDLLRPAPSGHGGLGISGEPAALDAPPLRGTGGEPEELSHDVQGRQVGEGISGGDDWAAGGSRALHGPETGTDSPRGTAGADLSVVPEELAFQSWCDRLLNMVTAHKMVGWKVGKHLVEGEDRFGDLIYNVVDQDLGVDLGTIQNWMSTYRAWPQCADSCPHDRSFTFHQLLAHTQRSDPEKALVLMAESLSTQELRAELRAHNAPPLYHECPLCGLSHRVKV